MYWNESFNDLKRKISDSFDDNNDLIWQELSCTALETWFAHSAKIDNTRLNSNNQSLPFEASIKGIKMKVSMILKEIFVIRLTAITTWFDQNCLVQHWKRDFRIPQKLTIADLIPIIKASHLKRQLKVLKRKFQRS